jgi:hypothetical protein
MGTITFLLPDDLSGICAEDLERATVLGGQDCMPYCTQARVEPGQLLVTRRVEESGFLALPWPVPDFGLLMTSTATVIERPQPYQLLVELARGKVNQVRSQASDWLMGGLQMSASLAEELREASLQFARALGYVPTVEAGGHARQALHQAFVAAELLAQAYVSQVFEVRHLRQTQLDTTLACEVSTIPGEREHHEALLQAFNTLSVPFPWNEVEPAEADYRWEERDALVNWACEQGLQLSGGPLINFTPGALPDWLWLWQGDLANLSGFMCEYVEKVVRRYRGRIRTWELTLGSNATSVLGLGEDELLWLTIRLVETARQVDPHLEAVVTLAQPWGEYMARQERNHSPFAFADTLIRSGINLAALGLEVVMGASRRGSYTRDLLEMSRLLDFYALLGVPLQVTLGYPSALVEGNAGEDEADGGAGHWRGPITPEQQAKWIAAFVGLAMCKPAVRAVKWTHFADATAHVYPNCGLIDHDGVVKPGLGLLQVLRAAHLR